MAHSEDLIVHRPQGLYCTAGDFYIDPWRPVEHALITHAHGDHARHGHARYLAAEAGAQVLHARLGNIVLQTLPYRQTLTHRGVEISLHPAGHVLGSAQIRLQYRNQVWVVSGDYKLDFDPTCTAFESVACDVFITESTFGLPIYRWRDPRWVFADINAWWQANAREGVASILYCYAFGKAQRILAGIDPAIGPIVCHGAVENLNQVYRASRVPLPPTQKVSEITDAASLKSALVLAPPSAAGSTWLKRFGEYRDAFASGWMQLRGNRRRRGVDRGFVLSDHADWPSLQKAIADTGAQRIIVTHGQIPPMVRWLCEQGYQAQSFETEYGDEEQENISNEAIQDSNHENATENPETNIQ